MTQASLKHGRMCDHGGLNESHFWLAAHHIGRHCSGYVLSHKRTVMLDEGIQVFAVARRQSNDCSGSFSWLLFSWPYSELQRIRGEGTTISTCLFVFIQNVWAIYRIVGEPQSTVTALVNKLHSHFRRILNLQQVVFRLISSVERTEKFVMFVTIGDNNWMIYKNKY